MEPKLPRLQNIAGHAADCRGKKDENIQDGLTSEERFNVKRSAKMMEVFLKEGKLNPEVIATYSGFLHIFSAWIVDECYVSITHVNSISVSDYHVTFLSTNSVPRHTTVGYHIISVPLFTWTFLRATLSYSEVISYVKTIWSSQWISTWTLYSSFQPLTLCFRVWACMEQSLLFITCLFHVSQITCSYI